MHSLRQDRWDTSRVELTTRILRYQANVALFIAFSWRLIWQEATKGLIASYGSNLHKSGCHLLLGLFSRSKLVLFNLLLTSLLILSNRSQLGLIRLRVSLCLIDELHLSILLKHFFCLRILFTHLLTSLQLKLLLLFLKLFLLQLLVRAWESHWVECLLLVCLPQRFDQKGLQAYVQLTVLLIQVFQFHHTKIRDKCKHLIHLVLFLFHLLESKVEKAEGLRQAHPQIWERCLWIRVIDYKTTREPV